MLRFLRHGNFAFDRGALQGFRNGLLDALNYVVCDNVTSCLVELAELEHLGKALIFENHGQQLSLVSCTTMYCHIAASNRNVTVRSSRFRTVSSSSAAVSPPESFESERSIGSAANAKSHSGNPWQRATSAKFG
eukprot:m.186394 g.186394  ORF g.186394 m.186394 type:complete len:134 (-) comp15050_c0_seq4:733-1134(-)